MLNIEGVIDEIIKSYYLPLVFKKNFNDRVRNLVNNQKADWDNRASHSAKHFLAAVCFRETAIASSELKDSLIYQPIGLYYSMFHMSLAMLWLNPRIEVNQLREIHHRTLIGLVDSQLVEQRFIKPSFLILLKTLKEFRELCNYKFGYQDKIETKIKKYIDETETEFEYAITFIHQVLKVSDSLTRFQIDVGDGFCCNILDTYLSCEHQENVNHYILFHGLTV